MFLDYLIPILALGGFVLLFIFILPKLKGGT